MRRPVCKALTFRASSIGDCLMGKYFLENIHAIYPSARCGVVVGSRGGMIRDLFADYPWIEVIEANRKRPRAIWYLLKNFWGSDIVLTQYTGGTVPLTTKLMARLLAKSGGMIGFSDKSPWSKYWYDHFLPLGGRRPARVFELEALTAAGVPVSRERLTFQYRKETPHPVPELVGKKYIVVHLFSGAEARGLSPARKQALIDALVEAFPGMPLVCTGSKKEHEELGRLQLPAQIILPQTTVQEAAVLIDKSAGVVAVDTGMAHIAAQIGKPVVVLATCLAEWWKPEQYGGTIPAAFFSVPEACPNGHDYTSYAKCMDAIDMKAVAREAARIFQVAISHV